jgi:septum formation protein
MQQQRIILASQSPRRKLLLQQIGVHPICQPVNIDEQVVAGEVPEKYCARLALEKARMGWQQSEQSLSVLGSDTIVVYSDKILGKPSDEKEAMDMLQMLSNQQHQVITAVALVNAKQQTSILSINQVIMGQIPDDEMLLYVNSKEPLDKAGSYGIQGYAARWIKHIDGSHSGIMGLPLYETTQLLRKIS